MYTFWQFRKRHRAARTLGEIRSKGKLNAGLTNAEIIETFIQLVPYVGFPKVLNAISVAEGVLA